MKLAKDITAKYPQAEFYGVSCKAHRDVCAEYTIRGYPTVHAFPAGSDTSSVLGSRGSEAAVIKALKLDEIIIEPDRKLDVAEGDETATEDEEEDTEEAGDPPADSDTEEEDEIDTGHAGLRARGGLSNAAKASDDGSEAESDGDAGEGDATETEEDNENVDSDAGDPDSDENSDSEGNAAEFMPAVHPPGDEDETDATADEVEDSDATEDQEADVMDLNKMAPPADVDEEEETDATEEETDGAAEESFADEDIATDADKDMATDAEDETDGTGDQTDGAEDETETEDFDDRLNGAPRDGKDISEAVKAYREEIKANGTRPGAGAQKGKTLVRDMDKWKEMLAKKRAELKRGRLGRRKKKEAGGQGNKEGATNVMQAHTPGTSQYKERMQLLLKKINKLRKKRGLPAMTNPIVEKSQMPLKKEVKKPGLGEKVPIVKRVFKMSQEEQLILDSSLSFIAGLKYGVFMTNDTLTAKQKAALKGWLDLMSVSLPPEWGLHSLIDELNENIDMISQSNESLLKILHKHPLPRRVWSPSCIRRDSPQGFSCGMWKLLHTSTVGIAEQRGGLNLVQSGAVDSYTRVFSPADAADTIREYLAHFFGCIECRNHFLAQYDECSFRRCDRLTDDAPTATAEDWKQLALWLWEVHNDVSVRVAHERIDREMENVKTTRFRMARLKREDEIKHLYPTLEQCFQCFDENGSFDEHNVFEFLEATYWSGPDVTADKLLQYRGEEGSGSSFFWFFVILVLAAVYMIRGRKVDGLQRTVNAAMVQGRKMGGKKRSV